MVADKDGLPAEHHGTVPNVIEHRVISYVEFCHYVGKERDIWSLRDRPTFLSAIRTYHSSFQNFFSVLLQ